MRVILKVRFLVISASCAAILTNSILTTHAAETVPAEATALANAMQITESTRAGITATIKARADRDPKAKEELACVERVDFAPVETAYAEAFAQRMTTAEMNEAREFFMTPLGQKYVRFSTFVELINRKLPASEGVEWLTDAETDAVQKFASTATGQKLMLDVLQSSDVKNRLLKHMFPLIQHCTPQRTSEEYVALMSPSPKPVGGTPEAGAKATPASLADVRTLVQLMRDDEIILTMLRDRMTKDPRVTAWDHACSEKLKPASFTDAIATKIVDKLTAEEVAEASAYFRSTAGRKFVQLTFDNIRLGDDPSRLVREMTVEELQEMRKFVDRPAGQKIYRDKVVQGSAVVDSVGRQFIALMTQCRTQQGR